MSKYPSSSGAGNEKSSNRIEQQLLVTVYSVHRQKGRGGGYQNCTEAMRRGLRGWSAGLRRQEWRGIVGGLRADRAKAHRPESEVRYASEPGLLRDEQRVPRSADDKRGWESVGEANDDAGAEGVGAEAVGAAGIGVFDDAPVDVGKDGEVGAGDELDIRPGWCWRRRGRRCSC